MPSDPNYQVPPPPPDYPPAPDHTPEYQAPPPPDYPTPEFAPPDPVLEPPPDPVLEPPPDHSGEPRVLSREENGRLLDLRARQRGGMTLTDSEREDMEALAAVESESAGHVTPPAVEPINPHLSIMDDLLGAFEHLVEVVPAAAGLRQYIRNARMKLEAAKAPVPALEMSDDPPAHYQV